eukprot:3160993-Rhodomonas_salina.1
MNLIAACFGRLMRLIPEIMWKPPMQISMAAARRLLSFSSSHAWLSSFHRTPVSAGILSRAARVERWKPDLVGRRLNEGESEKREWRERKQGNSDNRGHLLASEQHFAGRIQIHTFALPCFRGLASAFRTLSL